jgi:hypothetical protein
MALIDILKLVFKNNSFEWTSEPTQEQLEDPNMDIHYSIPSLYGVSKRENHGNGYHAHLMVLQGGGLVRDGYVLTVHEGGVVAFEHNSRQRLDINKHARGLKKVIDKVHYKTFNPKLEWQMPPENHILLTEGRKYEKHS